MKQFEETLHEGFRIVLSVSSILYHEKTSHQELIIFDNPIMGRVLALDHVIQTTSRDEYIYHEMLVHPALVSCHCWRHHVGDSSPIDVLVIGGGDGGTVRELLRYPSTHVVMVEIDRSVIDLCRRYLPDHSLGAFENERLHVDIADGASYVKECGKTFDVIIVDSTDPIGPGEALFGEEFFTHSKHLLKEGGIFVNQNGVSFLQGDSIKRTHHVLKRLYRAHRFYQACVPSYVGGVMMFAWGSDMALHGRWTRAQRKAAQERSAVGPMRHYTPDVHQASFVLPMDCPI